MTGQGCPPGAPWKCLRGIRYSCFLLMLFSSWSACAAALPRFDSEPVEMRLRVAWGGEIDSRWHGQIRIQGGTISDPVMLGVEADEAATFRVHSSAITIHQRTARSYDGIEFTVRAPLASALVVELSPHGATGTVETHRITLADLVKELYNKGLDNKGNRLLIRRAPGDSLQVRFENQTLLFDPGEKFTFEIIPHFLPVSPGSVRCEIRLRGARGGGEIDSMDRRIQIDDAGNGTPLGPITLDLPREEGVYDLVVTLRRRRLTQPLATPKALVERSIQLAVIAKQPPPDATAPWNEVGSIDPANPGWRQWLKPRLPLMPELWKGELGNGLSKPFAYPGRQLVELGTGGWQAYPLPIAEVGKPHIVEVEYASHLPQTLQVSVLETDSQGRLIPMGRDSGVDVPVSLADRPRQLLRHRMIFWPRTKAPLLLLANRHPEAKAVYGTIRVLAGPAALPPADIGKPRADERLLAAYFDKPLFAENFDATETADPATQRSLDDWQTFLSGGQRMVQYLRHTGFNGAIVSVVGEGSAIYPSRLLGSNPKYDSGVYFSTGQDARRKDVLEMMYRLFDRQGMRLVPALQLSSPLPELEAQLWAGGPESQGVLLVDSRGQSWTARTGSHTGPIYNPLNPRVQAAIRRVVAELTDRYSQHPSFAGVALQLGPDTFLQLPGEAWGWDENTRARFERSLGPNRNRRKRLTPAQERQAWLEWRSREMAQFHQSLRADLKTRGDDSRLYLVGAEMLNAPSVRGMLAPRIPDTTSISDAMLQLGFDATNYGSDADIVFLHPRRLAPRNSLVARGPEIELASRPWVDSYFAMTRSPGSLFVHEPLSTTLKSFDEAAPLGPQPAATWFMPAFSPSDIYNRQRFVHSLAMSDSQVLVDGGWVLPKGQEDSLKDLFKAIRTLPARRFKVVLPPHNGVPYQPVVVRTLQHNNETLIYVVNDSPWPVTTDLEIQAGRECRIRSLDGRPLPAMEPIHDSWVWSLSLQPYDVVVASFNDPLAVVDTWRCGVDREVVRRLQQEVQQLSERANRLRRPQPMKGLENADFESSKTELPGWVFARTPGVRIAPDPKQGFESSQSLHLSSSGPVAWVRSDPIPAPSTGRVSVLVRLRTSDPKRQPPLRLAIEGRLDGVTYYRPANVGGAGPGAKPIQEDWGSQPFLLQINDLPEGLDDFRIGFDLMGPGEVWIDAVEVYDLRFLPTEFNQLLIRVTVAAEAARNRNITDCERYLLSYWPQLLKKFVPLDGSVAARPVKTSETEATAREAKRSVWDRMRVRLPKKMLPFEP